MCLLSLILGTCAAHAEQRALIIGVSSYDDPDIPDLRGPANDALLMSDVLEKVGFTDIELLGDMPGAAVRPTHAAIIDAFTQLAARAEKGDQVYIHLSGHGSREIDVSGDETDGLDEIFLPSDTRLSDDGSGIVPNALSDDEIGDLVALVRASGADVFLVMDSCHSGSGTRALETDIATREVDPRVLGVDISQARMVAKRAADAGPDPIRQADGDGRFLAFYATRSNDVAREVDMSHGAAGDDSQWFGLFSAALAARLETRQSLTYRQLFQAILSDLNKGGGFGMAAIQTPLWEGDMIDDPVFGNAGYTGPARYLVDGDTVEAGLLHGFDVGTLVALIGDIADPEDAVIGYAQVEEAEPRRAYLRPVSQDCVPDSKTLCAFDGSLPADAHFAQIELSPVNLTVRFSSVLDMATGQPLEPASPVADRLRTAVALAARDSGIGVALGDPVFDVQVILKDDQLWFGPSALIEDEPMGLSFSLAQDDAALGTLLVRILKAERLAHTLDQLGEETSPFNPSPVVVDAERNPSDITVLDPPGSTINPRRECKVALGAMRETGFQPLEGMDDLKQCDLLRFRASGSRDGQRDVNRIHIDAQYCVHVDYELVEGDAAMRELGAPMVMCSDCLGPVPYSAGYERLYVLVSELEENAEALNLSNVLENCGSSAGTRGADAKSALSGILEDAAGRGRTRGSLGLGGSLSDVWVDSYRWRVLPRDAAFARSSATP
ncbi:caspase family protein [Martelella sp. HB161492]|uniref:caspase family protein n=1 Tax=Martelella sp. HB161492 TaxID=2720726 RepID=UPI0015929EDB|nr:caspase family protein [Martelella sp. HB161492]